MTAAPMAAAASAAMPPTTAGAWRGGGFRSPYLRRSARGARSSKPSESSLSSPAAFCIAARLGGGGGGAWPPLGALDFVALAEAAEAGAFDFVALAEAGAFDELALAVVIPLAGTLVLVELALAVWVAETLAGALVLVVLALAVAETLARIGDAEADNSAGAAGSARLYEASTILRHAVAKLEYHAAVEPRKEVSAADVRALTGQPALGGVAPPKTGQPGDTGAMATSESARSSSVCPPPPLLSQRLEFAVMLLFLHGMPSMLAKYVLLKLL